MLLQISELKVSVETPTIGLTQGFTEPFHSRGLKQRQHGQASAVLWLTWFVRISHKLRRLKCVGHRVHEQQRHSDGSQINHDFHIYFIHRCKHEAGQQMPPQYQGTFLSATELAHIPIWVRMPVVTHPRMLEWNLLLWLQCRCCA
jgi:hypothetical protein